MTNKKYLRIKKQIKKTLKKSDEYKPFKKELKRGEGGSKRLGKGLKSVRRLCNSRIPRLPQQFQLIFIPHFFGNFENISRSNFLLKDPKKYFQRKKIQDDISRHLPLQTLKKKSATENRKS